MPEIEIALCSCDHEMRDHGGACGLCTCGAYDPVAKSGRKCKGCRQMQRRHKVVAGRFICASGKPSPGFAVQYTQPGRVSQSFGDGEINFLDELFEALLYGGDLKRFASHPEMGGVCRKIIDMRNKSAGSLARGRS